MVIAEIDARQFNRALERYLLLTSKTAEEALNGKARDLMFMSAKFTPKANRAAIRAGIQDIRAVAVWRQRRRTGFPPFAPKKAFPITTLDITNSMHRLNNPSVAYMKSAFAKAGKMFPKTQASTQGEQVAEKYFGTKATCVKATLSSLMAMIRCEWKASDNRSDVNAKQKIATDAFKKAVKFVYEDMRIYFLKKAAEAAAQVSAK